MGVPSKGTFKTLCCRRCFVKKKENKKTDKHLIVKEKGGVDYLFNNLGSVSADEVCHVVKVQSWVRGWLARRYYNRMGNFFFLLLM